LGNWRFEFSNSLIPQFANFVLFVIPIDELVTRVMNTFLNF